MVLQGGLSTIVSAQYDCPGYWDCSDETRWGITAGSGAAIVVGAITVAIMGPRLSARLEARRELRHESHRLRTEGGAIGARQPKPTFDGGLALDHERQGFRATIRFQEGTTRRSRLDRAAFELVCRYAPLRPPVFDGFESSSQAGGRNASPPRVGSVLAVRETP